MDPARTMFRSSQQNRQARTSLGAVMRLMELQAASIEPQQTKELGRDVLLAAHLGRLRDTIRTGLSALDRGTPDVAGIGRQVDQELARLQAEYDQQQQQPQQPAIEGRPEQLRLDAAPPPPPQNMEGASTAVVSAPQVTPEQCQEEMAEVHWTFLKAANAILYDLVSETGRGGNLPSGDELVTLNMRTVFNGLSGLMQPDPRAGSVAVAVNAAQAKYDELLDALRTADSPQAAVSIVAQLRQSLNGQLGSLRVTLRAGQVQISHRVNQTLTDLPDLTANNANADRRGLSAPGNDDMADRRGLPPPGGFIEDTT
ncbi:hypothetical protein LTR37_015548 [Vermiconidia calcicola]|uniref:Uncharacterized protein n=1 Tax=Vermiconidia calcicola TaxID=1690605 RepID=A0ACC3MQA8_9PEZI|nr:hypothetical protein LTR37_015548 [Vermiconidia calcicola]